MPEAWRIVKEMHAATAFNGEGAAKTGGRWNSRGVPVVYTSSSQSLAALENLVHLNPPILFRCVVIRVEFNAARLDAIELTLLPKNWRAEPPPPSTRLIGDTWVREARSAVLAVPSVIIPSEMNYLLNPAHSDFGRITLGMPEAFAFDPRLLI